MAANPKTSSSVERGCLVPRRQGVVGGRLAAGEEALQPLQVVKVGRDIDDNLADHDNQEDNCTRSPELRAYKSSFEDMAQSVRTLCTKVRSNPLRIPKKSYAFLRVHMNSYGFLIIKRNS